MNVATGMIVLTISRQPWEKIIGILCWVLCWARNHRDLVSDVPRYQGQIVSLFFWSYAIDVHVVSYMDGRFNEVRATGSGPNTQ